MTDFEWARFLENSPWPVVMAIVLWRFGKWLDPKVTLLVEAFAEFLKTLGKELAAQTSRMDRHSDLLKEIAPKVQDIHRHIVPIVPTHAGREDSTVEDLAARRAARVAAT